MGIRRSRAEWESLITEMEVSGQGIVRFSAGRGLEPRTLQWWRWKLRRAEPVVGNAKALVRVIPVDVIESAAAADVGVGVPVEISFGDLVVRIAVGTEPAYVAALVEALRARC